MRCYDKMLTFESFKTLLKMKIETDFPSMLYLKQRF